jgi:ubiquinone/menaquinone biosynthesis C-methylase UbiE
MAKKLKRDEVIEGKNAYMYAKLTRSDMEAYKQAARHISENISENDKVLEVAPGPGYTILELAKLGKYSITGMDLSFAFVEIGEQNAREAGAEIKFCQGNVSDMPFENEQFDFIFNRAAFKNFLDPVGALNEMYRVLKPDGKVLIEDLNPKAGFRTISDYVDNMHLNMFNSVVTKGIFLFGLRRTAHSKEEFEAFIVQTKFKDHKILVNDLGFEVWLYK